MCYSGRKLSEFHTLNDEDEARLRKKSGRDFNLSYINKLLIRLADKMPDNQFYSKKSVLNHMAKALTYEMRNVEIANNETFNFGLEASLKAREEYLSQIEYSRDTSPQAQLEKKILAVLPNVAYEFYKVAAFLKQLQWNIN